MFLKVLWLGNQLVSATKTGIDLGCLASGLCAFLLSFIPAGG